MKITMSHDDQAEAIELWLKEHLKVPYQGSVEFRIEGDLDDVEICNITVLNTEED
jgi:hypothetical protein